MVRNVQVGTHVLLDVIQLLLYLFFAFLFGCSQFVLDFGYDLCFAFNGTINSLLNLSDALILHSNKNYRKIRPKRTKNRYIFLSDLQFPLNLLLPILLRNGQFRLDQRVDLRLTRLQTAPHLLQLIILPQEREKNRRHKHKNKKAHETIRTVLCDTANTHMYAQLIFLLLFDLFASGLRLGQFLLDGDLELLESDGEARSQAFRLLFLTPRKQQARHSHASNGKYTEINKTLYEMNEWCG